MTACQLMAPPCFFGAEGRGGSRSTRPPLRPPWRSGRSCAAAAPRWPRGRGAAAAPHRKGTCCSSYAPCVAPVARSLRAPARYLRLLSRPCVASDTSSNCRPCAAASKDSKSSKSGTQRIYVGKGKYVNDDPAKYPGREANNAAGGWAGGEKGLWRLREELKAKPPTLPKAPAPQRVGTAVDVDLKKDFNAMAGGFPGGEVGVRSFTETVRAGLHPRRIAAPGVARVAECGSRVVATRCACGASRAAARGCAGGAARPRVLPSRSRADAPHLRHRRARWPRATRRRRWASAPTSRWRWQPPTQLSCTQPGILTRKARAR